MFEFDFGKRLALLPLLLLSYLPLCAAENLAPPSAVHLFILSGQSNMVGLDPSVSFTPAVTEAFGEDSVIVVKDAQNSQPIRRWVKDWKSAEGQSAKQSGDLYDRMMASVNAAVDGRDLQTVTLVWMQGEADAARNQVGIYKDSLDGLLDQLREDFGRNDIRFVLGRLSDYSLDTGKHPQWQPMRDLQVTYADANPLGDWVNTDDLNNKTDRKTGKPKNDVHYTSEGYRIFGGRLADKAIELVTFDSLSGDFAGKKSDFKGYDCYQFKIDNNRVSVKIICPKQAAPGKPWLWRSLFWEAIDKFNETDLQLVDEGFHVVLVHGDVAGHPRGNKNIDAAYQWLTQEHGFAKTCSMASMSRGTLSLFRWATENPEKVNSIYVDNGVCNVLSWPAGKLVPGNDSIASGAPASWKNFKKKFGYASDEQALKTKESPIDLLDPLANSGVPILMVCGSKDEAVPYKENDAIMEQRYKKLGGNITVIVEDKGHSHGMNDPTPVLDFIREYAGVGTEPDQKADGQDQDDQSEIDYAVTTAPKDRKGYAVLPIDPQRINVVPGNLGKFQPGFKDTFRNHMSLWTASSGKGPHKIQWSLNAPADGVYEIDAVVEGKDSKLTLTCNDTQQKQASVVENKWHRISLGQIALKPGVNTLTLEVKPAKRFSFDAFEIVQPDVKTELQKEALAMRVRPNWFANADYGLMFQWTNRATPPKGPIKPWEQKVNDFDLDSYVDMVEETGAAYVLWSVTWGQQYISAPNKSLDAIIAGRTTKRDLLGEMADALHQRGIKLIFYYHYGYDCNHSIDADWMNASGGYKADKTEFYEKWKTIVSEMGDRYGHKLHGWWFDGGQRYYNCHFDNTPGDQGILSAPFKELTEAAKRGNPNRVVAYNSWVKPRQTEYQDYYGGEGAHIAPGLKNGVFQSGPQQGLLGHGCFTFESKWGHIEPNTTIPKPRHSLKKLIAMIQRAQKEHFPLSINLEMYEDGSVSPESVAMLKRLRSAVTAK